jgi:hypothetical protein
MLTGIGGSGKAQMSALEQNLQISEQMLNAFAALARKHQVPSAPVRHLPWQFNYIGEVSCGASGCRAADNFM